MTNQPINLPSNHLPSNQLPINHQHLIQQTIAYTNKPDNLPTNHLPSNQLPTITNHSFTKQLHVLTTTNHLFNHYINHSINKQPTNQSFTKQSINRSQTNQLSMQPATLSRIVSIKGQSNQPTNQMGYGYNKKRWYTRDSRIDSCRAIFTLAFFFTYCTRTWCRFLSSIKHEHFLESVNKFQHKNQHWDIPIWNTSAETNVHVCKFWSFISSLYLYISTNRKPLPS